MAAVNVLKVGSRAILVLVFILLFLPVGISAQTYGDGTYGGGSYNIGQTQGSSYGTAIIYCTAEITTFCYEPPHTQVAATSSSTIASTTIPSLFLSRFLSIGMSGEDVVQLQGFLREKGFYSYSTITGYFGDITKAAVKAFQLANSIDPIGVVGPLTRAKIFSMLNISGGIALPTSTSSVSFSRDMELGSVGEDVKQLQIYLNIHGFIVAISGPGSPGNETTIFGSLTKAALIKFQVASDITPAIGYFGPKTRAYIKEN